MGYLIPTLVMDMVPGDYFDITSENFTRMSPLVSPAMHRINQKTYLFFVPNRILWPNWEKFISPTEDSDNDIVAPVIDFATAGGVTLNEGDLADYMGLPADGNAFSYSITALPFAAYCKIWDEWFRDQNLQDETFVELVDGDNLVAYSPIATGEPFKKNWEHDYFTSALPFAQKGDTVTVPLIQEGSDPIVGLSGTNAQMLQRRSSDGTPYGSAGSIDTNASGSTISSAGPLGIFLDPQGTLSIPNLQADAASITDLRTAFRLQEFLERDATGGTRYIETIYNHFGVKSSDKRLNRPEFIGMYNGTVTISEVLQTSETNTTVQGNLAGHGISVSGGPRQKYYAEEHGWLIGLTCVIPKTAYSQGLHRKWQRETRLDYYWPSFQHIGEQEIKNKEVFYQHSAPEETFGYVPRYAEYKYENNRVSGEFRTSLNYWHLAREFTTGAEPNLNSDFIECNPANRIFAVPTSDTIYAHIYHRVRASRLMSFFGRPIM